MMNKQPESEEYFTAEKIRINISTAICRYCKHIGTFRSRYNLDGSHKETSYICKRYPTPVLTKPFNYCGEFTEAKDGE